MSIRHIILSIYDEVFLYELTPECDDAAMENIKEAAPEDVAALMADLKERGCAVEHKFEVKLVGLSGEFAELMNGEDD